MTTYTIPECKRSDIEKRMARYQKKAERYGCKIEVEYGKPYTKKIPVYKRDHVNHVEFHNGDMMVEVFDISIDGDDIRKGEYRVLARIEHLEDGNIVTAFGEVSVDPAWGKLEPHCDHCNCNHNQHYTFIVEDMNGNRVQVGRNCLKDYCGIDPQMVGMLNEINCIIEDDDIGGLDYCDFSVKASEVYDARKILHLAVKAQKAVGYIPSNNPGSNKELINKWLKENETVDQKIIEEAEKIADGIINMDEDDAFKANLNNVKSILTCGYCKMSHFGYIACAPMMFDRYMMFKAKRDLEKSMSDYLGEIGKRITVELKEVKLLTSWPNAYGYTFLYKMLDNNNNVIIWQASKRFEGANIIKATVKAHNIRDGIKQTVVTRCTAI